MKFSVDATFTVDADDIDAAKRAVRLFVADALELRWDYGPPEAHVVAVTLGITATASAAPVIDTESTITSETRFNEAVEAGGDL